MQGKRTFIMVKRLFTLVNKMQRNEQFYEVFSSLMLKKEKVITNAKCVIIQCIFKIFLFCLH